MKILVAVFGLVLASQANASLTCGNEGADAVVKIDGKTVGRTNAMGSEQLLKSMIAACEQSLAQSQCVFNQHVESKPASGSFGAGTWEPGREAYDEFKNAQTGKYYDSKERCRSHSAELAMDSVKSEYKKKLRAASAKAESDRLSKMSHRELVEERWLTGKSGSKQ